MKIAVQKRRRYVVKKGLQFRYMSLIVVCISATTILAGSLLYVEIWQAVIPEFSEAKLAEKLEIASQLRGYEELRAGRQEPQALNLLREAQLLSAHERAAVAKVLRAANARLIPRLLFLIVVVGVVSLLLSHRLAGPVYRLGRSIRTVSEGDLTTSFTLRQGDELKDFADALETMVRFLRSKIRQALTSVRELSHELQQLSAMGGDSAEVGRRLEGVKACVAQLEQDLSVFKLG